MTNEELVGKFPECPQIKRDDIRPLIEQVFAECKVYREIYNVVMKFCRKLYPEPARYNSEDPECEAWYNYFCGDYDTKQYDFKNWIEAIEQEFLVRTGQRRTFEEACRIAAEEWSSMIFDRHVQDNGDKSEGGFFTMMLATINKADAAKEIEINVPDKFKELMTEYYLSGCKYKGTYGEFESEPYSDYGPNAALADILTKAGVPQLKLSVICPWKTGIHVDSRDGTVVVRGYQKERYI